MRSGQVALAVTEAGDPTRPTVIMIHGYPDTKEVWQPVMERLAGAGGPGFHVVAYDVRGAGRSSAPGTTAAYDLARLTEDFAAVRDAVAPGRAVHLVGHDWGGIQGWEFACDARLDGALASYTSIAGPALGHAVRAARDPLRTRRPLRSLRRLSRSWYILPLVTPGAPALVWGGVITPARWRRYLALEGIPTDAGYPAPTLLADGRHGARLYRRNIPPRLVRRRPMARARVPVQLIVPTRDRYISRSYYAAAEGVAPGLVRRSVDGPHWVIRTDPGRIAGWIAAFAEAAEG